MTGALLIIAAASAYLLARRLRQPAPAAVDGPTPVEAPPPPVEEAPAPAPRAHGYQRYPHPGIFFVVGRRRCGKTTFAKSLVAALLADGRTIAVIHDPLGQYPGKAWSSVEQFAAAWAKGERYRVNCFRVTDALPLPALAIRLSEEGERTVLAIDELDLVAPSGGYIDGQEGAMREVVRRGRHYKIDLVGTTQRPTQVHCEVAENSELIVIFALFGRNAVRWVEETCGEKMAVAARNLHPHEHIIFDPSDVSDIEKRSSKKSSVANGRASSLETDLTGARNHG